jgi:methionyl-tRNA synthetase
VPSAEINGNMRTWCAEVDVLLQEYIECMENNDQRDGLRKILSISKLGNKLIQVWQPWVKVKSKVTKSIFYFKPSISIRYNNFLFNAKI